QRNSEKKKKKREVGRFYGSLSEGKSKSGYPKQKDRKDITCKSEIGSHLVTSQADTENDEDRQEQENAAACSEGKIVEDSATFDEYQASCQKRNQHEVE